MNTRYPGLLIFCFPILFPGNDKQQPDPRALLLGAEQFRSAVHSGTLEVVLETYDNRRGRQKPNVTKVKVVFDGLRRTFHEQHDAVRITKDKSRDKGKDKSRDKDAETKIIEAMDHDPDKIVAAGFGERFQLRISTAFDGVRLCNYLTNQVTAAYRDVRASSNMIIDPRLWGLFETYNIQVGLLDCFSISKAKVIELVGEEQVNSVPTWHVRVELNSVTPHYWVEGSEPFRVHKVEYEDKDSRTVIASGFKGAADKSPLPTSVNVKKYYSGTLALESNLTVVKKQFDVPVDPSIGTIESLDLPLGIHVIDHTVNRGLGIWDGHAIVKDTPETRQALRERAEAIERARYRSYTMRITIACVVVALLIGASLTVRRWRRRARI